MTLNAGLSSRWFDAAEGVIRGTGLRRSKFGRNIVAALNSIGRLGLKIYFSLRRGPVAVQGQKMDCRTWEGGSFRSTLEFLLDRYEPETTRFFQQLLQPGMMVVDIGAHGGYFSLIGASRVGATGKVYAFEPYPASFAELQRNIELNGYKNIHAVRKAVSDRTGVHKLLVNPKGSDRHSLYAGESSWEPNSPEVETTRLDDFLEGCNWPQVELIKMDIEGAEPAALAGMKQTLEKCGVRFLITEFSPASLRAAGFDPERFLRELSVAGFSVFALEGKRQPKPLTSGDSAEFVQCLQNRGGTNLLCEAVRTESVVS